MDNSMTIEKDESGITFSFNVTLTREEYERLLLMLAMACGCATRESMTKLSYDFVRLTNKLMEGKPNWHPYWVPQEEHINGD
jgi:hypothetical protein